MNKRIFWTAAALLTAAFSTPSATQARPQNQAANPSPSNEQATAQNSQQLPDVVKVGEYQSTTPANDTVIARIQTQTVATGQTATLYVRNIPVLTFVGSGSATNSTIGVIKDDQLKDSSAAIKVATIGELPSLSGLRSSTDVQSTPVWQAARVAAKLNCLSRERVDASKITVHWQPKKTQSDSDRYLIKVNGEALVEINAETHLADTTKNLAKDALQVTNRLRLLLGNASPLRDIAGLPKPKPPKEIALGPIRISLSGWASWYGPEFQGNRSANGEIFNQNAMTAAHRTLPFGTQVRVTNMSNGRSVVVRINDRGPYIQGRIIDLSTAAARVLGLVESGVAPVRVDVIGQSLQAKQ